MTDAQLDPKQAHQYFSAACFNDVWTYLDKPERSESNVEQMIETAHASLYHWLQRADCTADNKSIGYWQLSRVYATVGNGPQALAYAEKALASADPEKPFMRGYGHEAMARAAFVAGDDELSVQHIELAKAAAAEIVDANDKQALLDDLASISMGA